MTLEVILESDDFKHWFNAVVSICAKRDYISDEDDLQPEDFLEHYLSESTPEMAVDDLLCN